MLYYKIQLVLFSWRKLEVYLERYSGVILKYCRAE